MKTILVSNSRLAASLKDSLAEYTPNPTVRAFCFEHPHHTAVAAELTAYLMTCQRENPGDSYLILADAFGSVAWLETMVALEKCGLKDRSVVYTGANLPMLLQLYDEDEWVKRNTKDILMNVNHQAA